MIHTDVHSHILPGIDDGARNIDISEGIINRLFAQGVEYIAATPHFRSHRESVEHFCTRRAKAYESLCRHFSYDTMKRITVAAEVALEYGLSDEKKLTELTYGDTNYILLEFPFRQFSQRMLEEINNIQYDYELVPVIAHIDRYIDIFSQDDYDTLLSQSGAIFQINNTALLDKKTRRLVSRLIEEDLPFVLGSDSHDVEGRAPDFDVAKRVLGNYEPHRDARRFLDALKTAGIKSLEGVYSDILNNSVNAKNNSPSPVGKPEEAPREQYLAPAQYDVPVKYGVPAQHVASEPSERTVPEPSAEALREGTQYEIRSDSGSFYTHSGNGTSRADDLQELKDSVRKISDSFRRNERPAAAEGSPEVPRRYRESAGYDPGNRLGQEYTVNDTPEKAPDKRYPYGQDRVRTRDGVNGSRSAAPSEKGYYYSAKNTNEKKEPESAYQRGNNVSGYEGTGVSAKSFIPLIYFFAAAVLFSFVLPRLGIFSHTVDVSASDVRPSSGSIVMGDEGADVTSLQKKLYSLGYLDFDGVTGRYDETTVSAVNAVLERRNMEPVVNCSYENYGMLMALTPQELESGSDTASAPQEDAADNGSGVDDNGADGKETAEQTRETTTTTASETTAASTAAEASTISSSVVTTTTAYRDDDTAATRAADQPGDDDAAGGNKAVRILIENTRLRSKPKMKSTVMFWVQPGDEFSYLGEEYDDQGTKWYKLQYKDVCQGYVLAEQAELVDR